MTSSFGEGVWKIAINDAVSKKGQAGGGGGGNGKFFMTSFMNGPIVHVIVFLSCSEIFIVKIEL